MIIRIKDEINTALDFNQSATDLFNKINQIDESEFIIDFEGVFFYHNLARIPRLLKLRMNRNVRGTFIFNNFPYLFF